MHQKGNWDVKDAIKELNEYELDLHGDYINKKSKRVIGFLLTTDWWKDKDEDWKRWEQKGNEYVVLYKKNKDYLISA